MQRSLASARTFAFQATPVSTACCCWSRRRCPASRRPPQNSRRPPQPAAENLLGALRRHLSPPRRQLTPVERRPEALDARQFNAGTAGVRVLHLDCVPPAIQASAVALGTVPRPAVAAYGFWFCCIVLSAGERNSTRTTAAMLVHLRGCDGFQRRRAPLLRKPKPSDGPHGTNLL